MTHNYRISCDCCYTCKHCEWEFSKTKLRPALALYCVKQKSDVDCNYICDEYADEGWHLEDKR